MATRPPLRFYFSLRSPYSWLACHDLRTRYRGFGDRLEWIPFWEPDELSLKMLSDAGGRFVYTPMSRAKHLYVLQDARRLAHDRGLVFTWPVDRSPWWEVPHLAYLVARRQGRGAEFIAAALRARWEQGRDICDRETVAELAVTVGVDPAAMCDAVNDPGVRAEGIAALLAIYRDGVFGVPFFVRGYDRYWGVDRLPAFVDAVRAGDESIEPAEPAAVVPSGGPALPESEPRATDGGHAGGCG